MHPSAAEVGEVKGTLLLEVPGEPLSSTRIGHFGTPALAIAGLAILALILHLATPYAHVTFDDAGSAASETFSRSDIADHFDVLGDNGPNASPGLTLAGIIVAMVGAAALVAFSFMPLRVTAARWAGWGSAAVASVGAAMAFVSSMWWVGSGFGLHVPAGPAGGGPSEAAAVFASFGLTGGLSGLLEVLWRSDSGTTAWVISPALVAPLSLAVIVLALRICGNVAAAGDGVRERTRRHLRGSLFAMIFVGVVLLVPWAIGELPDTSGTDRDFFAQGAHTILNTRDLSGGESFSSMAYAIEIMVVTAWIGFAAGIVGSAGGILASMGAPAAVSRAFSLAAGPTAIMLIWSAVLYLLTWIYMWRPFEGAEGWQPGYFPLALAAVIALWAINVTNLVAPWLARVRSGLTSSGTQAISFD